MKTEDLLKEFCETLTYPIYFLSIKATRTPKNDGFEYTPYQYSVHIEYSNGFIEHKEFLAKDKDNIKSQFVQNICKDIPLDSTIVTNHITCDRAILQQLANEYHYMSFHLLFLMNNLKDLAQPFKENWNDLLYLNDDLLFFDIESIINESNCCNKEFEWGLEKDYVTLLNEKTQKCNELQWTLLEYSKIDTLLMVEILKKLRTIQ